MLENIGLNLSESQYIELENILDFDGSNINDFIDLCYSIIESRNGVINTWFCNIYGQWKNPQQLYDSITSCHCFIPANKLKDYINDYYVNWYLDDITDIDDIKISFNLMLEDFHTTKDGYIKTSYC